MAAECYDVISTPISESSLGHTSRHFGADTLSNIQVDTLTPEVMLPTMIMLRRPSVPHPAGPSGRLLLRTIHTSRINRRQRDPPNPVSHGVENYFVDGDDTPPPNTSIYKVDATSDAAQSAYEPPSGQWSQAGTGTEYRTVSEEKPHDVPNGTDVKLRYSGTKRYMEDKGPATSKAGEDLEDTERWGRKPEGRA